MHKSPNFLIIGAARCGTSYLAKNIGNHPQVFMPSEKELHFFDHNYEKGLGFYLQHFKQAGPENKCIGEATPNYLFKPYVPELIRKDFPNIKLIAILRNPSDRAYSSYKNLSSKNPETKKMSFIDKLEDSESLISRGFYEEQLQRYYKLFDKANILVLFYEDMIDNPENTFQKVFSFLGVNANYVPLYVDNKINSSSVKSSKYLYFIYKLVFNKKFQLSWFARKIEKYSNNNKSEIDTKTRKYLAQKFKEPNKKLEKFLNVKLKW